MTKPEVALDSEAISQLGHEQRDLLDTIDSLRNLGVELDSLPQIIVVGDKSAGKSSVLEAISRVRFPVKSGLCTRSPTELVLRKASQQRFAVKIPGRNANRPLFHERQFTKEDLPRIIQEAKDLIGIGDGARDFSEEVLRVEISGPDMPHLTLVDLPGLYHSETKDESSEGMTTVDRLAERYMKQKNTLILAVVSAKSDMSLQAVLRRAKKHDPLRERTLGVITKPDKLETGTSEEATYFQLAQNQEPAHTLKLGWHVLRNRDSRENGEGSAGNPRVPDQERDDNERAFLSSGIWENVPFHNKGVEALRGRLSGILTRHIQRSLPGLIDDIENKLSNRQHRLTQLGHPRKSDSERRDYLLQIANRFRDTAQAATRGYYGGRFFSSISHPNANVVGQQHIDPRKLRAVVRNLNCAFDTVLSVNGAARKIQWESHRLAEEEDEAIVPSSLEAWVDVFQAEKPQSIAWLDLKEELEIKAANNQGTQFPGSPNDRLALELFRHQSQRWGSIAEKYLDLVLKAARSFVQLALEYIVGSNASTRDAIIDEYVDGFFRERAAELQVKLNELLVHYQDGDAICLEDDFQRRVAKRNRLHLALRVKDILLPHEPSGPNAGINVDTIFNAIKSAPQEKLDNFGLERVAEMMTAYYEMSLRTFTDNVIILAAENCLIAKIPDLLTAMTSYDIDEEKLKRLADEPQIVSRERVRLSKEIQALKVGLRICERHRPWGITPFPAVVRRSETANQGHDGNGLGILPSEKAEIRSSRSPKMTGRPAHGSRTPSVASSSIEGGRCISIASNTDSGSVSNVAPGGYDLSSSPIDGPSHTSYTYEHPESNAAGKQAMPTGLSFRETGGLSKRSSATAVAELTRRSSNPFSLSGYGISPATTKANSTHIFGTATIQSPLSPPPRETPNGKFSQKSQAHYPGGCFAFERGLLELKFTMPAVKNPCLQCKGDEEKPKCRRCRLKSLPCSRPAKRSVFRYDSTRTAFSKEQQWVSSQVKNFGSGEREDISLGDQADDSRRHVRTSTASSPSISNDQSSPYVVVQNQSSPSETLANSSSSVLRHDVTNHPGASGIQADAASDGTASSAPLHAYDSSRGPLATYDGYDRGHSARLSPTYINHQTPVTSLGDQAGFHPFPLEDVQEACLLRYYVEDLSHWFDLCDEKRHFQLVVPVRARRHPHLLNAIFAVSARHLSRLPQFKTPNGILYYGQLLPKLSEHNAVEYALKCIPALRQFYDVEDDEYRDSIITTAVILRQLEEIDDEEEEVSSDPNDAESRDVVDCPVPKVNFLAIINAVLCSSASQALLSQRSLLQAAYWMALRQEIFNSFNRKQAPQLIPDMDSWHRASNANKTVMHTIQVARWCWGAGSEQEWVRLMAQQDFLERDVLADFQPIFKRPADRSRGEIFPTVWYSSTIEVTSVQQAIMAKSILVAENPFLKSQPTSRSNWRKAESDVRTLLLDLCGIALCHPASPPALVNAAAGIQLYGEFFTDRYERRALRGVVERYRDARAWPVQRLLEMFKE